ncbi:UDP-2,3-diacylglucosamine diphosphatase [bacterium]|nr:UDP-2,3-diacylglucosamine diphosphatase [bacterium]MBU1984605.1 UDP-2,3-diacylglucosamine diphosphatase [bacterium]
MAGMPSLTPLTAPVYFLSDAHLGAAHLPDPTTQALKLDRFLDDVAGHGRAVIFVGDLFDFWYEWRHVVPKRYFRLLHRIRALVDHGVAVHLLAGNHDFRLRGFLERDAGIHVHHDSMAVTIGGQAIFVFHGDGLLARDHGYRLMKGVFRSRAAQGLFSLLHPDLATWIADQTSKTSRTREIMGPDDDKEYLAYARRKFAEGFRGVVMGHTHRPVEHVEGEHTYLNLGDWIVHFTYGVHDGTRLRLNRLDS